MPTVTIAMAVVEAAGRMREAVQQTLRAAVAGMGQRGGRDEREGYGERQASAHAGSPFVGR